MMKREKIVDFLIKPPMWLNITVWTIGGISLGLYMLITGVKRLKELPDDDGL